MKHLYRIGYLAYVFLFVLSLIFYKERTIFTDIAYHLFHILKDDAFAIQNFRYGAVVTQVFPLVGSRFSMSLEGIAILYSAAFVIYYAVCYFICGTIFRNYKLALVLLLSSTFFVTDTFYWIQSELPQGLAFSVVFFAFLGTQRSYNMKAIPMAMIFFSIVTIVFFHPLLLFPFAFAVVFFSLDREVVIDRKLLYASLLFYILIFLLKKYVFKTSYESNAMESVDKFEDTNYLFLYSNKRFLLNCLTRYYWIPVISICTFVFYIIRGRWKKAVLFSAFMIGYLLLVNVSYPDASVKGYYIENLYLPLGIFLALPFVYDILPLLGSRPYLQYCVVFLVLTTGLIRIYTAHTPYTARLDWERSFLKQHANEKLLIADAKVPMDILMMTWGTPYEFWLLSTIEQERTASIIINENVDGLAWASDRRSALLTQWGLFPYKELPPHYFKFTDTVTTYTIIK